MWMANELFMNMSLYSRNNLSTLPASLCSLAALSSLKLDYNRLTELPNEFGKLVKLEELDVSHNKLTSLPESIGEMACLLRLSASHNQLDRVPNSIGSMRGIVELLGNYRVEYMKASNHPRIKNWKLSKYELKVGYTISVPEIFLI